jgi:hypothetical protein
VPLRRKKSPGTLRGAPGQLVVIGPAPVEHPMLDRMAMITRRIKFPHQQMLVDPTLRQARAVRLGTESPPSAY